jgi:hypothetical protein
VKAAVELAVSLAAGRIGERQHIGCGARGLDATEEGAAVALLELSTQQGHPTWRSSHCHGDGDASKPSERSTGVHPLGGWWESIPPASTRATARPHLFRPATPNGTVVG